MFRRSLSIGAGALALLYVIANPNQLFAQHRGGGMRPAAVPQMSRMSPSMGQRFMNSGTSGFTPGFGRRFMNPGVSGFTPSFDRRFMNPRTSGFTPSFDRRFPGTSFGEFNPNFERRLLQLQMNGFNPMIGVNPSLDRRFMVPRFMVF